MKIKSKTGTMLGFLALGVAVACAALWIYQMRQVDIPENRTAFVVVFLAAVALGVAAFVKGARWVGGVPAVGAIFIGSLLTFTIAISRQEVAPNAIKVGDTIPHFNAVDDSGEVFDSDSLRGHPVLIKFFRAHW
jgi:cytochrome oxidase Cu insertion factor (SCO1/SenC/PrrC family)